MNFAVNKIKFYISKINKSNQINRYYSQQTPPEKDPFPSWKFIAFISGIGLYHQYVNQIKKQ
jgi:hypothetical protein